MSGDAEVLDMARSPEERAALQALSRRLELVADPTGLDPLPPDLRSRTLAAVERAAAAEQSPRALTLHRPRGRHACADGCVPARLVAGAGLVTAAIAAAVVIAGLPGGRDGKLEADTSLAGAGGSASVQLRQIGIGRVVDLDSSSLRILPKGRYYEVWFVGPGDSRAEPNRISAGTFHPDEKGRSDVQLKAAADAKLYPRMEVTAEPGDGDPRVGGPVVLRGLLTRQQ